MSLCRVFKSGLALIVFLAAAPIWAAEPDNAVEWNGITHIDWQDRRPLCPINGQSFEVRFQTYANDLTSARVIHDLGDSPASVIAQRGPYDIWAAQIPATAAPTIGYIIELTDGTDTDALGRFGMVENPADATPWVLNFNTLEHAPIGATPVTGGVVFKVWSPSRTTAHVRGQFNSWTTANPMNKIGEHFIAFVSGAQPGQMYKYFFNNTHWTTDARARAFNPTDNYNSIIVDPLSYTWQTEGFSPVDLDDMVIYQLHVGSFSNVGAPFAPSTYRAVADRADHLVELGVNAVMINPINEYPGDFSGGYNSVTPFSIESRLGTPNDLKHMIDQLHARGIAVLLDIIWNHASPTDNILWNYDGTQLYFANPIIDTPWGAQLDFNKAGVRSYLIDSAVAMLEEYRFDGFRMDATSYMRVGNQAAEGWGLMRSLSELIDSRWADKALIAEELPDDRAVTRPRDINFGAGFHAQYHDAFKNALRGEIFGSAFGSPNMFNIRNAVQGSGAYLQGRSVVNYFELHDEAWGLSGGQRAVKTIDTTFPHDDQFARSRTKLAQGIVMLAPGVPAMLMGTEWLEDREFEQQRLDWTKKTTYSDIFTYYQQLIGLRVGNTALRASSPMQIMQTNDAADVIAFTRFNLDGLVYLVVANFSNNEYAAHRIGVPFAGLWGEVLNSDAVEFGGSGFTNTAIAATEPIVFDGRAQSLQVRLARRSVAVFQLNPDLPICLGDIANDFGLTADEGGGPDGVVDFGDFAALLGLIGPCPGGAPGCLGDIADDFGLTADEGGGPDGVVDFGDFAALLGLIGECP